MGRVVRTAVSWLTARVCRVAAAWEQFWFTPADPIVLGVMRILVGGMLLYTHIVWGTNLPAFFSERGWMSPALMDVFQRGELIFSFWWYVPEAWHVTAHGVCLCVICLFWLGLWTRVTSILSLIISISYSYRAQFANYGLDQVNTILTFYLAIGPSGATLSIDRLIQRYRTARQSLSVGATPNFERTPCVSTGLATRLTQIHFCVIYFYAGTAKLQGAAWWSGDAMWRAFANSEYQSTDMTWLVWYPWIVNWMTHVTILWELSFSATIWNRTLRPFVLLMGVCMHFGIGAFMGMWTFGLIMTFGYLAFVPPEIMQRALSCLHRHKVVVRRLNVAESRDVRRAAWRLAFDGANHVRIVFGVKDVAVGETAELKIDDQLMASLMANSAEETATKVSASVRLVATPVNGHKRNGHSPTIPVNSRLNLAEERPVEMDRAKLARPIARPITLREETKVGTAIGTEPQPTIPVAKAIAMRPLSRRCVLCLERDAAIQLRLFRYFTSRGFRCLLAVEIADAIEQACDSYPDAILVMGTQLNDGEIESFHAQCKDAECNAPIVYVLQADQRQRIGNWLESDHTAILDAAPSLGETRRLIEQMLAHNKRGHPAEMSL